MDVENSNVVKHGNCYPTQVYSSSQLYPVTNSPQNGNKTPIVTSSGTASDVGIAELFETTVI